MNIETVLDLIGRDKELFENDIYEYKQRLLEIVCFDLSEPELVRSHSKSFHGICWSGIHEISW